MTDIYADEKMKQKPVYPTKQTPSYADWALFDMGKDLEAVVKAITPESTVVDDALSDSSENPVQNKVITNALAGKVDSTSLAAVATSGDYDDLTDKPDLSQYATYTLSNVNFGSENAGKLLRVASDGSIELYDPNA